MSKPDIRIGLIGLGAISPSHAFAIAQTEGCRLSALCDVRGEAAAEAGDTHGVPWFTDTEAMLAADVVDAVTICTPSGLHLEPALKAIAAGKHVLVEKPLEITTERVDRIVSAAEESGVTLASVFQSRYTPAVQRLKHLVDGGLLGQIHSGSAYIKRYRTQSYYDSGDWRGTWEIDGGGCLMNQGIHCVDLYLWFMGPVTEVRAITETMAREVEVETLALSLVTFASGARGVVEGTTLAYPEFAPFIEIYGSRGTLAFSEERLLHLELLDPTPDEERAREELLALGDRLEEASAASDEQAPPGTPMVGVDQGHTPIFEDFVQAIRTGTRPLVDGHEARRAVEFICAVYASGSQNSRPVLLGT